ncbi:TonB family protein [Henriciella marina]|uniref:TonB family protein n=1 Tax=Henriciella marina TaxID=453851 RepID=UPI00036F3D2F|nr:TonB family protein [Henriciella marina]
MLENSVLRPLIGLPLAGLIVFGLFSGMKSMISSDFEPPKEVKQRDIVVLTPSSDADDVVTIRPPLKPLDPAVAPPPPPKLSVRFSEVTVDKAVFEPVKPSLGTVDPLQTLVMTPVAIDERDARPIQAPSIVYPDTMRSRGVEGACEVHLNVDPQGRPFDVEAICSNAGFRREAERAIRQVRFVPKIERGTPVTRTGVVYPVEFRFDG